MSGFDAPSTSSGPEEQTLIQDLDSRPSDTAVSDRWNTATKSREFTALSGSKAEQVWRQPFFYACLADTQLGALWENESWDEDLELCQQAVEHINRLKPRFAIICGDLVHHLPEMYPDSDPETRTRQISDLKSVLSGIDPSIPCICCCGNHDVGTQPTQGALARYRRDFGDDYFSFWVGGVRGIVLNSNLCYDPQKVQAEYEAQQRWLEREMAAARAAGAKHIILFGHHPLFLVEDEEGEDDNEIGRSVFVTRKGEQVDIPNYYFHLPRERRIAILQLMQRYGTRYYFCGHFHQNRVSKSSKYQVENITTSAIGLQIGQDKPGFRIAKVYSDGVQHEYFDFGSMPRTVELEKE